MLFLAVLMTFGILTASAQTQSITDSIINTIAGISQPIQEAAFIIAAGNCDAIKGTLGYNYDVLPRPNFDELRLEHITPAGTDQYSLADITNIQSAPWYQAGKPLIIGFHGWTDDPSGNCISAVNPALLSRASDINTVILNATIYVDGDYLSATTVAHYIGDELGAAIVVLINGGMDPSLIQFVGHSLGCHVAGFTAKKVFDELGVKIGVIYGLDCSGPCFMTVPAEERTAATDASYVTCVHTNAGEFGTAANNCQSDYWANDGTSQPGCPAFNISCNHLRACLLFAESVYNPTAFPSVSCSSLASFKLNNCDCNNKSYLGYGSAPGTLGVYYANTAASSPYSLGEAGIPCSSAIANSPSIIVGLG